MSSVIQITLALDQALETTGYSLWVDDTLAGSGSFTIDKHQDIDKRLADFETMIDEIHKASKFNYLVFEGIQYQNNIETYKKLAYVQATIILWCYHNDVKYTTLAPSSWRNILGGGFGKNRKEQKQRAIEYVKEHFDFKSDESNTRDVTSDEADAICLGHAYQISRKEHGWN